LAAAVVSAIGLAYDPNWKLTWYPYAITFWLFCVTTALGTAIRAVRIFSLLFHLMAEEQE
jgi:hypothetical protein